MKLTHIINVGYPKAGTTWLWKMLTDQSWFSAPREKENRDLILGVNTVDRYIDDYIKYDITANFDPGLFGIDRFIINQLGQIKTANISIILRNPFELYWSEYNFLNMSSRYSYNDYTRILYQQTWFNRVDLILTRWQDIFSSNRFNIFFYDDLKLNPENFFLDYCKQMNLPAPQIVNAKRVNVTAYTSNIRSLDDDIVSLINLDIDRLQEKIKRDLTHWKQ